MSKHRNTGMPGSYLRLLVLLMLFAVLSACTTQSWYEGARAAKQANCLKEPEPEYEDCMKEHDQNYGTYSDERSRITDDQSPGSTRNTELGQ